MKFGKKTAFAALVAASALVFAGCAGGGDVIEEGSGSDTGSGDGEMYIAMVSKGFQHQFWQAVKKGAEEKAQELGVKITFEGPAAETEIAQQLEMLTAAIDKNPDAIAYAALDPEACVAPLEQAKSKDIPSSTSTPRATATSDSASPRRTARSPARWRPSTWPS